VRLVKTLVTALVAVLLVGAPSASAVVITPNTTEDQFNTDPGHCSLREAVQSSDSGNGMAPGCTSGAVGGSDTIQLAAGRYELTLPAEDPNVNSFDNGTGDLDFGGLLTVEALPGAVVTIDANQNDRIFSTFSDQGLTIQGITLTGGFVDSPGAGTGANGGAISLCCAAPLTVTNSTLSGNSADGSGGAISVSGTTTITNSTISGNESREFGGGGITTSGGTLNLESTTISANTGRSDGGMALGGTVAGGVATFSTTVNVHNSIIAGNTENAPDKDQPDCGGTLTSMGGNVIGSTANCTFTSMASDSLNAAGGPGLTPLNFRGGPTQTHGLDATSPAIDRGVATCAATDQRGETRAGRGASCDSGAFELGGNHTLTITPPTNGSVTGVGINCPGDCTESYADGSNIPLTPVPSMGFSFASWSGDCSGGGACSAIMNVDRTIGATFAASRTLTISVNGPGTVTGTGINCPGDCAEVFPDGSTASLTQMPGTNAVFSGWSGDCTGVGACDVPMTGGDKAVTATFIPPRTLTVTVTGPGMVTGFGIACPGDCTQDYVDGTVVPLTQAAGTGATFGGWSQDCAGTGACNPAMTANRSVGALFSLVPATPASPSATPASPSATPAPRKKCKRKKQRAATAKKCKKRHR
jgi:CSLREA domain-containing protein